MVNSKYVERWQGGCSERVFRQSCFLESRWRRGIDRILSAKTVPVDQRFSAEQGKDEGRSLSCRRECREWDEDEKMGYVMGW